MFVSTFSSATAEEVLQLPVHKNITKFTFSLLCIFARGFASEVLLIAYWSVVPCKRGSFTEVIITWLPKQHVGIVIFFIQKRNHPFPAHPGDLSKILKLMLSGVSSKPLCVTVQLFRCFFSCNCTWVQSQCSSPGLAASDWRLILLAWSSLQQGLQLRFLTCLILLLALCLGLIYWPSHPISVQALSSLHLTFVFPSRGNGQQWNSRAMSVCCALALSWDAVPKIQAECQELWSAHQAGGKGCKSPTWISSVFLCYRTNSCNIFSRKLLQGWAWVLKHLSALLCQLCSLCNLCIALLEVSWTIPQADPCLWDGQIHLWLQPPNKQFLASTSTWQWMWKFYFRRNCVRMRVALWVLGL